MKDLNKLMNIYSNDRPLLGALQELQQRRESELRPADKFLRSNITGQWLHMKEELFEVLHEIVGEENPDIEKIAEETVDLQMSCETMLAVLGLNKQQRMESRRKVIEKNAKRGYYEPQQGSK